MTGLSATAWRPTSRSRRLPETYLHPGHVDDRLRHGCERRFRRRGCKEVCLRRTSGEGHDVRYSRRPPRHGCSQSRSCREHRFDGGKLPIPRRQPLRALPKLLFVSFHSTCALIYSGPRCESPWSSLGWSAVPSFRRCVFAVMQTEQLKSTIKRMRLRLKMSQRQSQNS